MNILMMSRIFAQSGVGSHIKDLSKQLVDMGHTVHLISSTNDWGNFCEQNGISFNKAGFSTRPVRMIKSLKFIYAYIKNNNIDVVHCHHRICGFYMKLLSWIIKVPFVWSNHLDDIPHDFVHRKTTFYGNKVICVSTELKAFCINALKIPEKDIEVIIHGIRPSDYQKATEYVEKFKAKHGIGQEKIIGLFARMAPMKDHSCLIKAIAKLPKEKLRKTKTVLFGGTSGEYVEQLKAQIEACGLREHIIFEEFVTPSEALSLSDITVLPSLKEGFGIVSIESFLMRKPHIRTKTAGYEDLKEGCIGFDVGDYETLSVELEQFVDGKDYSGLIERASRLFEEKCTIESMTKRILDVYTSACKQ